MVYFHTNFRMPSMLSLLCVAIVKVKVKVALEQDRKDQRGSRGVSVLFL
jgi:hypothetical protein